MRQGASYCSRQLGLSSTGDLQELFHQGKRTWEYSTTDHFPLLAEDHSWGVHSLALAATPTECALWPENPCKQEDLVITVAL